MADLHVITYITQRVLCTICGHVLYHSQYAAASYYIYTFPNPCLMLPKRMLTCMMYIYIFPNPCLMLPKHMLHARMRYIYIFPNPCLMRPKDMLRTYDIFCARGEDHKCRRSDASYVKRVLRACMIGMCIYKHIYISPNPCLMLPKHMLHACMMCIYIP